jgi:hypothetical protein
MDAPDAADLTEVLADTPADGAVKMLAPGDVAPGVNSAADGWKDDTAEGMGPRDTALANVVARKTPAGRGAPDSGVAVPADDGVAAPLDTGVAPGDGVVTSVAGAGASDATRVTIAGGLPVPVLAPAPALTSDAGVRGPENPCDAALTVRPKPMPDCDSDADSDGGSDGVVANAALTDAADEPPAPSAVGLSLRGDAATSDDCCDGVEDAGTGRPGRTSGADDTALAKVRGTPLNALAGMMPADAVVMDPSLPLLPAEDGMLVARGPPAMAVLAPPPPPPTATPLPPPMAAPILAPPTPLTLTRRSSAPAPGPVPPLVPPTLNGTTVAALGDVARAAGFSLGDVAGGDVAGGADSSRRGACTADTGTVDGVASLPKPETVGAWRRMTMLGATLAPADAAGATAPAAGAVAVADAGAEAGAPSVDDSACAAPTLRLRSEASPTAAATGMPLDVTSVLESEELWRRLSATLSSCPPARLLAVTDAAALRTAT